MTDDWKPFGDLDVADAKLGVAKRTLRGSEVPGDANAQDAYEQLQTVIDRAKDAQQALE